MANKDIHVNSFLSEVKFYDSNKYVVIAFQNRSNKVIKYCQFLCHGLNSVGDVTQNLNLYFTGPLNPGKTDSAISNHMDHIMYGFRDIYVLMSVSIEYMDGSKDNIEGNAIFSFMNPDGQSKKTVSRKQINGPCYIATCVYGSYDCREVYTLRRYRDECLLMTKHGVLFVKFYYYVAPTIVKLFGRYHWFNSIMKSILDKKVARLKERGISDKTYSDI